MPIMLHDMEAFLDDAQAEVRRMKRVGELAYLLAMAVRRLGTGIEVEQAAMDAAQAAAIDVLAVLSERAAGGD